MIYAQHNFWFQKFWCSIVAISVLCLASCKDNPNGQQGSLDDTFFEGIQSDTPYAIITQPTGLAGYTTADTTVTLGGPPLCQRG